MQLKVIQGTPQFFLSIFLIFVSAEAQLPAGMGQAYYDYGGSGGGSEQCAGCSEPTEVNPEIVEFALSQISGINGNCYNVEVENFQSQVST